MKCDTKIAFVLASLAALSHVQAFSTVPQTQFTTRLQSPSQQQSAKKQQLSMVIGQQAESFGPASLLRKLKKDLPQFEWLAEGSGNPNNKIDMPDHVKAVLAQPGCPKREAESEERTKRIRARADQAARDAADLRGMLV